MRTPAGAHALAKLISVPDFQDWHDQSTVFDAMAYYATRRVSVTVDASAEYARLTRVTREFFRVFDIQPVAGRSFTADEEQVGAGAVLVSSAYARQHFVEPSRAIGQVLGASHLIEGSVRKAGDQLRISAELVKADERYQGVLDLTRFTQEHMDACAVYYYRGIE